MSALERAEHLLQRSAGEEMPHEARALREAAQVLATLAIAEELDALRETLSGALADAAHGLGR